MKKLYLIIAIIFISKIHIFPDVNKDLMNAIDQHDFEKVKEAVNNGADVNYKDQEWTSPLHLGFYEANLNKEIILYLIKKGANLNTINKSRGFAPAHYLIDNGHYDILKEFIEDNIIDINVKDEIGRTLLNLAIKKDDIKYMKLLLDSGADVNSTTNKGSTPLHFAVHYGKIDFVKLLLEHNADVNIKNNDGNTPLHYAYQCGYKEIIKLLKKHGADTLARNKKGQTPSMMLTFDQQYKLEDAKKYAPFVWYYIMAALPVTNIIGTPYWCGYFDAWDLLFGRLPAMMGTSYLSLTVGIFGVIPLHYGITNNNPNYTNAGIIMMSVCFGASYIINFIWAMLHTEGDAPFAFFTDASVLNNKKVNFDMVFKNDKRLEINLSIKI